MASHALNNFDFIQFICYFKLMEGALEDTGIFI